MYLKLATDVDPHLAMDQPQDMSRNQPDLRFYHRIRTGRHLFHEGDRADHLYEVKSGILRLARVLENGRRQIVAFGLPGDIVGFPAGLRHHTDCDALRDAVVLVHRRAALEDAHADPELHRRLTGAALAEICAMQDHVMMLSSKSAAEKVAAFLLSLTERIGTNAARGIAVDIAMRRLDIAEFLGLTTETVCRTMTQFRRERLIDLDSAQRMVVRDLEGLRSRAEPD